MAGFANDVEVSMRRSGGSLMRLIPRQVALSQKNSGGNPRAA